MGLIPGLWRPRPSVTPNGIVADGQLIPDGVPVYVGQVLKAKPFGVPSELANVVIHLADMAQFYGVRNVEAHMHNAKGANRIFERLGDQSLSFERAIATAHWGTAQIFEVHLLYPNYCLNPSPGTESWDGCSNSSRRQPSSTASTCTRPLPPGWNTCAGDRHDSPPARRRTANSQQNPGDETPGVFSCPKETNRGEEKLRPENTLLEQESKAASVQIYQSLKNHPKAAQEVAEALGEPFSLQAAHTAVLVMVHALAQTRGKGRPTLVRALKLWERTLDPQSRFLPIVPLALRLLKALPPRTAKQALPGMIQASEQLNDPAGAGRILQKLAHHRKQLAVYHTKPESAALMARLAIPEGLDWSDPKTVTGYRMADYSCGAGALLIAAYRRVRELHQKSGGSPRKVHAAVLKDSITLVDVLPASVALAAAGLDALEPKPAQPGGATRALTLKYGPISSRTLPSESQEQQEGQKRRAIGLGSLDILDPARAWETGPHGHRPGRRRRKAVEVSPNVPGPRDNEPALHQAARPPEPGPERPKPGAGRPTHQRGGAGRDGKPAG